MYYIFRLLYSRIHLMALFGTMFKGLPYWTNGNVPLVALIRAAGPEAVAKLDTQLDLGNVVDTYMEYILAHTNKTNGWIGPYVNEPGDRGGQGSIFRL